MSRRLLNAVALTILLISSMFFVRTSFGSKSDIKVGLYYYVWYGEDRHWNSVPQGQNTSLLWTVVDNPILGFYSSQDTTVIRKHLDWFKELGIDFLIISWWGPNSYEDESTKRIFSIANQSSCQIEIAIMVEAYNWSNVYDFKAIYSYIYDNYASQYESIYTKLDGKPLVCFYNDSNMAGTEARRNEISNSSRFTSRIVGRISSWQHSPSMLLLFSSRLP